MLDAAAPGRSTRLIARPFASSTCEVRTEHLHRQRALEPGLRLVDGVLGRLGVVEDDAGKGRELLVDGVDQLGLAVIARRSTRRTA